MASELGRIVWEGRPKDTNNGHEELLVFGYSCKLFRDNEKAQYVDKGEHLIPWMGDNSLMVDRYDVRGALYDLKEAESGGGGDRWEGLTEEERAEEEKCDHERYLALYHDEFQYQEYQDEESKRLMSELGSDTYTYSQVGFSYDGQAVLEGGVALTEEQILEQQGALQQQAELQQQQQQQQEQYTGYFPEADEDTFVPPPDLNVPPGMIVPETVKQNKIIVKTSKFIVTQGGQMEIVIKTKQAGNPMFSFLSFDNPLNAYYKHMVSMIKSGRYRPSEEAESGRNRKESEGSEGQYLHPSLSAGIKPDLAPGTPTAIHKPTADCAYSKLIHKIKEKQKGTVVVEGKDSPAPVLVASSTPVSAASAEVGDPLKKKKLQTDITPVGSPKITSLVDYPSFNQTAEHNSDDDDNDSEMDENERCLSKEMDCGDTEYSSIKWPPPEVQMVIDKMASYIIKNGADFEAMVRSRDDPRFDFMKKDHEYYPYYRCKIRLYNEVYGDIFKEGGEDKSRSGSSEGGAGSSSSKKDKRGNNKQPSTISFSIKSREQEVNLDRHSTFPVESSSTDDEDMEEEERERRRMEREERRRKRKLKEKEERERREREERERREKEEKERLIEKPDESTDASDDNEDVYDIFKYAQEMGKSTDAEEPQKPNKISVESEKKDSDSLSATNVVLEDTHPFCQPERKQQERRKKAAMFLSRLKKGGGEEEAVSQPAYGPQLPPEIAAQILNSASQSPRSSVTSPRRSTPSRSRSHSVSPGPGIPMPPREAPAPPPPPPPTLSPVQSGHTDMFDPFTYKAGTAEASLALAYKNDRTSALESCIASGTDYIDPSKSTGLQESSVLSGASEEGRRSQSIEMRRSKSRQVEASHREKTRSRKKQRRGRSESRSPSSRRDRKKRKRSRSRSRRHKKRRSRSRSHSKTHSRSSHKKKRRKHSSRHERDRGERRSKKSRRRSISSSSSYSSERSYSSSRSSSESEDEVQVIDSPAHSKRGSRASSEVSVGASDLSLVGAMARIPEESMSGPSTPLPPLHSSALRLASAADDKMATVEEEAMIEATGNGSAASSGEGEIKEEKKEEKKPLFNPQSSAAMAKIAMGLRAKVHALLEKESKL
ncbi:protein suppressor of white apricot-like [Penaeus indicus]|uniref:protein suppressor of white apricot-like n=2 Tax=Penaeus indicus TaxID=29960 RepID=UPI00300DB2FA